MITFMYYFDKLSLDDFLFFFLMIRRPPRSTRTDTLFSLHDALPICFAWGYATHKERVLKPMIRKRITDPWREVSWQEAIDYAASEFRRIRSEEHTSELQSLMRISYAVFCLKKKHKS